MKHYKDIQKYFDDELKSRDDFFPIFTINLQVTQLRLEIEEQEFTQFPQRQQRLL